MAQDKCEDKGCSWLETDDPKDCVITTTTTETPTTTTEAPGCCYGDSYKANGKCLAAVTQGKCENKGCSWLVTDDPSDCEMTTTETPTTTPEPGCCAGDSARTNDKCNERETRDLCDRSSSCHWRSGEAETCEWDATTTVTPGCCFANPEAAYSPKWMTTCTGYYTERECTMLTNADDEPRCVWEDLVDGYDCSLLWPTTTTTTAEPGCCKGSSYKAQSKCQGLEDQASCERKSCEWLLTDDASDCEITTTDTPTTTEEAGCCKADAPKRQDMCDLKETRKKCDRSSSCHWLSGEDQTCEWEETTTVTPGCCFLNPEVPYNRRYHGACISFFAERECLMLTDDDGDVMCAWEDLVDGYDCSQLWPSTTTTTDAPGCCMGDSYKSNGKCAKATSQDKCEDKGCNWLETDDPEDCVITTTETPTTTTTTPEPGCCRGDSYKANDKCAVPQDEMQCVKKGCEWVTTDDPLDCVLTTATPTDAPTDAPGCCYGDSYKSNDKCAKAVDQDRCETQGCNWMETDDPSDCEMTTTETPTTTEEVGCCKGDSMKSNEKCNLKLTIDKCQRSSSCHWITDGDVLVDCVWDPTEPPEEPGCCYINPEQAYNNKYQETCVGFYTEPECLMLIHEGISRCTWEAKSENYDCSMLWPTTTTTTDSPTTSTPGCCRGDSYDPDSKCSEPHDEQQCVLNGCEWFETDDPTDCKLTESTTETPVTESPTPAPTEEPGCCYGDSYAANDKCRMLEDFGRCETQGCNWMLTDDPSDCELTTTETPTTTEEPGCCTSDNRAQFDMCFAKATRDLCERAVACYFNAGEDAVCEPQTTPEPTTTSAGCCVIREYSPDSRWIESCAGLESKSDCLMPIDVDHLHRCAWFEHEADCEIEWVTTTSEPWMGAKVPKGPGEE